MGCCNSADAAGGDNNNNKRQEAYANEKSSSPKKDLASANKDNKLTTAEKQKLESNNNTKKDPLESSQNNSGAAAAAAKPKTKDTTVTMGSSLNAKSSVAVLQTSNNNLNSSGNINKNKEQQQFSSLFGTDDLSKTSQQRQILKCSDYLPGMQGRFECDAFCHQRSPNDGGTVWGGGEAIEIELVPFGEQMKDNKNQITDAAFKALMNAEDASNSSSNSSSSKPKKKIYAASSCICRAALHAGVISNEPDENGEQKSQFFAVISLVRKHEDAGALKAPLNDFAASERYVKHMNAINQSLPELKEGSLFVKKEWPASTIVGSEERGIESFDVSSVVSSWVCFV